MNSRRIATLVLIAALAGGVGYLVLRPQPVQVETARVASGPFRAFVQQDGKTRVRNRYVVSSPLSGRILRIELKPGDDIRAGARVARLLPALPALLEARTRQEAQEKIGAAEASLQEAVARLERAQAQEVQSRRDLERIRTLQGRGAATSQQLEREELSVRLAERDRVAAEMRRHAMEHEVDQARAVLQRYERADNVEFWDVTAPVDGQVLRVVQESEGSVASGTPLLEIGDPRDLEVIADVLTTEAVELHPGAAATIESWGGGSVLEGRVSRVEPAAFTKTSALGVEEQRVWVVIDLLSPREQWKGLGDQFRADVSILAWEASDAVLAPSSALFRRGDGWAAFVVENGKAIERPVRIARRAGRMAAIAGGLAPGDQAIVFPPASLREGMRVRLQPASTPSAGGR